MRSERTRPGGRYIARERGSEAEPEDVEAYMTQNAANPLIERLSGESLTAMAGFCGVTVSELERRYEVKP